MDKKLKPSQIKSNKQSTLLVISHTGHYVSSDGRPSGWIPTVREIDYLATHFKKVIHLAVLYDGEPPLSTVNYSSENVQFESIPSFGGPGLRNKLKIFLAMVVTWGKMHRLLKETDVFQFRAPTSIGLFIIPLMTLVYRKKKGWYKYAGNWNQPNMALSYRLQKWMLEIWQSRPLTINGRWPNQPKHVHSFENPCLAKDELVKFRQVGLQKTWKEPLTGCFVGRMEDAKGVHRIVELLLSDGIEHTISDFHFVGDGTKQTQYKRQLASSKVAVYFHGFSDREKTFEIYSLSNLFLLPSDSEGFPKVVAEAAAFGCVPIVSDVSSIGQYVTSEVGYLWNTQDDFTKFFQELNFHRQTLASMSSEAINLAEKFTFSWYWRKLKKKRIL